MASTSSAWTDVEVKAIVDDYLDMLLAQATGKKYSKSDHRRMLLASLDPSRTEQAIEFKHANISAVMIELGLPYIHGYKPRGNYQAELKKEIERRLKDPEFRAQLNQASIAAAQQHPEPESTGTNFGPNQWLVDELYDRYLADPSSVDRAWWSFFADYHPRPANKEEITADNLMERVQDARRRDAPPDLRNIINRDALAAVNEVIGLDPASPDARALKAELLQELGDSQVVVSDDGESVTAEPLAGGYDADEANDPEREDALGFNDDVNMLCSVLAAKATRPPLSVGLFGEWGSGKSFFMRLMRQRIEKLASTAYRAERNGEQTRYCSHVVHINFNAWHYMDANLWASLAVEIFNRLATPPPPGDVAPTNVQAEKARMEKERVRVLKRLDNYQRLVTELTDARQRAEQERERIEKALAEATERRQTTVRRLAQVVAADIGGELDKDPELTALRNSTAQMLGMSALPSSELSELVGDLRRLSGQIGAIWRLLAKRKGSWIFWLVAIFIATFFVGLVFLATPGRLVPASASLGVAVAAISGFAARARPVIASVGSGLDAAESALRRAEELEQQFREQQTKEQIELEAQIKGLAMQEQSLAAQVSEAAAEVAEAKAEEEDLRAGRRLHRFLEERSGASDYRSHLGLISLLHQDLQQLSTLLQLTEEDSGRKADAGRLPRIDRIILYIDDLDRCPPTRVVEVLQAIHLLLALPLFVVVVGVDPRWLLRSLQRHYHALLTSPATERSDDANVLSWASTPQNYLEKIFQIPFALMPMTDTTFARLVASLAVWEERFSPASDAEAGAEGHSDFVAEANTVVTGKEYAESRRIQLEEGSIADQDENIDPNPMGLTLTDEEIHFLQALAPLVATPRAGKRLMNIYRMIRSTQAIGGGSTFLNSGTGRDGDYKAVLQLLAIVSGFPDLAGPVLASLMTTDAGESWSEFVDTLVEQETQPLDVVSKGYGNSQTADLSSLQVALQQVRKSASVPEALSSYRAWAPKVARFSFFAGFG